MNLQQAYNILGVTPEDDLRIIKSHYHRLMSKHHPDLVDLRHKGQQKLHIEKAQLINEAYTLLKSQHTSAKASAIFQNESSWDAPQNLHAYCERNIYFDDGSFKEHKLDRYQIARGKYYWNPEMEDFSMFLYSLNNAASILLEQIETETFSEPDTTHRMEYQIHVFHLLSQEFINPYDCLQKIAAPIKTQEVASTTYAIYRFKAMLSLDYTFFRTKTISSIKKGSLLHPQALRENKLYIKTADGIPLGHLSFTEDYLYFILIPLMQNAKCQVKIVVESIHPKQHKKCTEIKLHFYLRLAMPINSRYDSVDSFMNESQQTEKQNQLLKRKLLEYKSYISND